MGLAVDGFELDQAYEGTGRVDDPGGRFSRVLSLALYTRIGLGRRLVALISLPVDDRLRSQDLVTPSGTHHFEFRNTSVGDLSTIIIANVWPWRRLGPTFVNIGVGMKWPTGPDDATQDGLMLPIELQTGTGTFDPIATLSGYRLFGWGAIVLAGAARFPTEAESGYRYGVEKN